MMNKKTLVFAGTAVGVVGVGVIAYKLFKLHKLRNDNEKKLIDIFVIITKIDALFCYLQRTAWDEKTPKEIHTLIREKCDEMLIDIRIFKVEDNEDTYESDNRANYYSDTTSLVDEVIVNYASLFNDLNSSVSSPEDGYMFDKYIDFYNAFYDKLNSLVNELKRDCLN